MLVFTHINLSGATYWVAPEPTGNDHNEGSREKPWATANRALAKVEAGDTVIFRDGHYLLEEHVIPTVSGTPEAWITLAGYPGEKPVFDGVGFIPAPRQVGRGLIHFEGPSYIRISNLHVRNSNGFGFMVREPSTFIEFDECSSEESFGPGFGVWYGEHVKILRNEVTRSNTNRQRLYGDRNRQAMHEAISTEGARHFEIAWNHVHHGDKEGIDIKGASAYGVVHHNYVHDMPRQGLYADAWFGVLEDVEFHHNIVHTCEWGIAVSTEDAGSEVRNVRIHHNLAYNCRGSGFFFSRWNKNGPRKNIIIAHNTFYANGSPNQFSGPTGNIDLRSENVSDVFVFNNLCLAGGTFEIGTFADPDHGGLALLAEKNIRISHNFIGQFSPIDPDIAATVIDGSPQHERYLKAYALPGNSPISGNAALLDPENGLFFLTERSAPRNAGLIVPEFHDPGQGAKPDVGAFPFGAEKIADEPLVIEQVFENTWRVRQTTLPGRSYQLLQSIDGDKWIPVDHVTIGNYLTDSYYFTVNPGDEPPLFRYKIKLKNPPADH